MKEPAKKGLALQVVGPPWEVGARAQQVVGPPWRWARREGSGGGYTVTLRH